MLRTTRSAKTLIARASARLSAHAPAAVVPLVQSAAFSGCPFMSRGAAPTAAAPAAPVATAAAAPSSECKFSSAPAAAAPKGVTPEQIAIVKSTVPLLETGGEALIKHFYSILMKNDAVRPMFNQTHQKTGAQPRALAASVLAYAKNIDALENLGALAAQIVNKHVSFNVKAEHYPIVGASLLRAIREVLGPAIATDTVIDAWAAAYGQLADILIAAEAKVYDDIAAAPGGWRDTRKFIVAKKTPVSSDSSIMSFELVPKDGGKVIKYQPGQYIGIDLLPKGAKETARRNYSLSQESDQKSLRITVKKLEGGIVSTHLHDNVKVGDEIDVFPPAGEFVLSEKTDPLVLISAGVGITPCMAMLQAATGPAAPKRPIAFLHYTHTPLTHAFVDDVMSIAKNNDNVSIFTAYTQTGSAASPATSFLGRVTKDHLNRVIEHVGGAGKVDTYLLGPAGFMKTVKGQLQELGVPKDNVKYEFFGPAQSI